MAIPRKARFTERINKMRGLMPIEKDLLRRIGEIIDGGLNNRGPTNPGTVGVRRTRRTPILPPPRNLRVEVGPKNAKIEWNPVDSPILLMYEVEIVKTNTRITEVKTTFTNRLNFGGQGSYKARVRSIGRDGTASPYSETILEFTLVDNLLFLDGNGVAGNVVTDNVIEDIQTPESYRLFSWGAFNSAAFVSLGQSNVPVMNLSVNGFYPIISKLLMLGESRFFSNIDDSTLPGISRPGAYSRNGMFTTPLSAMFKPLHLDPTNPETRPLINTTPKFYMFLNNTNNDSAGANLTLLSIPASVVNIEEEEFINNRSIDLGSISGTPIRTLHTGRIATLGTGGSFTIGMWIKIPNWNPVTDVVTFQFRIRDLGIYGVTSWLPSKTLGSRFDATYFFRLGHHGARYFYNGGTRQGAHLTMAAPSKLAFTNADSNNAYFNLENKDTFPVFPFQGNNLDNNLLANAGGKWTFVAATFNSNPTDQYDWTSFSGFGTYAVLGKSNKQVFYIHGNPLLQRINIKGNGVNLIHGNVYGTVGSNSWSDNILVDTRLSSIDGFGYVSASTALNPIRVYWIAIWDGLLASKQLKYLAQNPSKDLRIDSGDYSSSGSLAHWWVFGDNPQPLTKEEICNDRGFSAPFSLTKDSTSSLPSLIAKLRQDRPNEPSGQGSGVGLDS